LADTQTTPIHSLTLDLKTSKANVINDQMTQLRKITSRYYLQCLLSFCAFATVLSGCASSLEQNHTNSAATKCHEVRGAMDVGSGSTKIKVALVDICEVKILKVLAEDQAAIAFKENIDTSGNLSSKFMLEANEKIVALAQHAVQNGVPFSELAVVATQAAREAKNIDELKASLARKSIVFTVISQQEEAELGHQAAALVSQLKRNDFTSFDIGGGSFQLVNESGTVKMLGGQLASVSFKNHVLTAIQKRAPGQSPNPIRKSHASLAIQYAYEYSNRLAANAKGFEIKKTVVGIGGVFGSSIRNQLRLSSSEPVTTTALENEIPKLIQRTPKELDGPFADTESTNLLLVLGLMKGLGIKEVSVFKANLTDGVLVTSKYYRRFVN
jgi:exopolyphosphatase/guanosine-5'-triphosphate,3'-diphosphate pyrophosphatase